MSSSKPKYISYNTEFVDKKDRFDAFRQYMEPLAELDPISGDDCGGIFDLKAWDMGDAIYMREINPGAKFRRSKRKVRSSPNDHYYIYMIKDGENLLTSDSGNGIEKTNHAFSGSVALHSMIDVNHGIMRGMACEMVFLPRDLFGSATNILDKNINMIFSGPIGRLLADFLMAVNRDVEHLTASEGEAFSRSLVELLRASFSTKEPEELDRGILEHVSKVRIRHYVARNLANPTLSPTCICREMGISRASLYRLFEPEGGVANYILARRLEEASKMIRAPEEGFSLQQIALKVGLRGGADLSRSFRRSLNVSPSELRALGRLDPHGHRNQEDFDILLRRLA